jgi:hypothetical protein
MADTLLAAASLFPKFEIRISKSETISKFEVLKSKTLVSNRGCLEHLGFLSFDIVSSFEFRASNLLGALCAFAREIQLGLRRSRAVTFVPSLADACVNGSLQLLHVGKYR